MRPFHFLLILTLLLQFVYSIPAVAKAKSQVSQSSPFPWFEDQFEESHSHSDMVDGFDD